MGKREKPYHDSLWEVLMSSEITVLETEFCCILSAREVIEPWRMIPVCPAFQLGWQKSCPDGVCCTARQPSSG